MLFIFDMGGVVSGNVHAIPAMAGRLGIATEDFYRFAGVPDTAAPLELYNFGLLEAIQKGSIGSAEFWNRFAENARSEAVRATVSRENLWETCFHPERIPGTVDIILRLKSRGFRVVCGTNTLDAHYGVHRRAGDYDIFDAVYASHLMGVIKPRREFWDTILAAEHVHHSDAFFVDDNGANADAAREAGLQSHLFTSPENLADALARYLAPEAGTGPGR